MLILSLTNKVLAKPTKLEVECVYSTTSPQKYFLCSIVLQQFRYNYVPDVGIIPELLI